MSHINGERERAANHDMYANSTDSGVPESVLSQRGGNPGR